MPAIKTLNSTAGPTGGTRVAPAPANKSISNLVSRSAILLLGIALVSGCTPTTEIELQPEPQYADLESFFEERLNNQPRNYGTMRLSSRSGDVTQAERIYTLEAMIYNEDKTGGVRTAIDGGSATISNIELISDPDDPEIPNRYFKSWSSLDDIQPPGFGQLSNWGLAGNPAMDIPNFAIRFYVPADIRLSRPPFVDPANPPAFSKSGDLEIRWNGDPNLRYPVLVHLNYTKDEFNTDPGLPDSQQMYSVLANDEGSYFIPATALDNFPTGANIVLTVSRGNYTEPVNEGKEIYMYAVLQDSRRFVLTD